MEASLQPRTRRVSDVSVKGEQVLAAGRPRRQRLRRPQPRLQLPAGRRLRVRVFVAAVRAIKEKELTGSQMVSVSQKAWRAEGSRMFIEPRKSVSVDELLRGEIVQSGNDAAIALAEAVSGSEDAFVVRMNQEAARLGMKNTHFANATGLPSPQHVSTAA